MDRHELRRLDYSLSRDHTDLQSLYRQFFTAHCPIETVRAAEPLGFDASLWRQLCATRATAMALPETVGGDGATLVDLTLVAEEIGRALASVPWIDHVAASRLWGQLTDVPAEVRCGDQICGLDPHQDNNVGARLLPAAAIAEHLIVRDGHDVVAVRFDTQPAAVDNVGCMPMAWVDPAAAADRQVLASGPAALEAYQHALDEWRLLTAAALTGATEATMLIAAAFAKTRYTLGVPIASLQAISHPLADIAIIVAGARNLNRRAAWFADNEPHARPELPSCAFVYIAGEAPRAAAVAVHVQGGLGVSAEAAASAYLVRVRGWALAGGDPAHTARHITELVNDRESSAHLLSTPPVARPTPA
ncbi:acyl-CoA dehydrogenase [Mycobacterium sp. 852002-51057_SCH5723018]|uniref:acyl-CoA dehydrogenase n=1 Tax=Mycobacterium sp. 852002-51057_SCH5723018 TaxID=1834094 RepID=UPI0007FC3A9A|nr:acyl-CoA dehydrogenase [Mycobacterium sp. 852002-51057_SCH5723018]OBG30264.1 acyl-CoA dehydrogenase [Mycobacterium sp. 852002-51057_SCH5723018]